MKNVLETDPVQRRCFAAMNLSSPLQPKPVCCPAWLTGLLKRALRLVILGVGLTLFYTWAVPRFHPRAGPAGFYHGLLHGAIMPMAMPALLAGQDVTIYAEQNTGRSYKLGYTFGINLCGIIVFGTAFWSPRSKPQKPELIEANKGN